MFHSACLACLESGAWWAVAGLVVATLRKDSVDEWAVVAGFSSSCRLFCFLVCR